MKGEIDVLILLSEIREMLLRPQLRHTSYPPGQLLLEENGKRQVLSKIWRKGDPCTLLVWIENGLSTM